MPQCFYCKHELIWGGDHDDQDMDGQDYIVSNLSCPECNSFVLFYLPIEADNSKED